MGLRGAVPIVLATYPVLVGAPGADRIFHVVFFIVVVNALVPGATVAWVTRRLGLQKAEPPAPQAVLAIESRLPLEGELMSFYIDEALVVAGIAAGGAGLSGRLGGGADRPREPAGAAQGGNDAPAGRPRVRADAARRTGR